jgi:hypothetical protein
LPILPAWLLGSMRRISSAHTHDGFPLETDIPAADAGGCPHSSRGISTFACSVYGQKWTSMPALFVIQGFAEITSDNLKNSAVKWHAILFCRERANQNMEIYRPEERA